MILRILKYLGYLLSSLIGLLIFVFIIKYITCPVYQFNPGKPFAGDHIYNPYQNMDSANWLKGNFQVQSYAWGGFTSGRKNTNNEIYNVYKSLGYDIIATSDYQKINRYHQEKPGYIPVYEHGYGIWKNHQVLLGARRVLWKDYPFFQTIHNKQNILNKLRKENDLVFIAHPKLRNGYSLDDMKILTNYDGIEVLNNYRTSTGHWDAALSAGNYVTIMGNDDAHDISNPDEIGHHCTLINAPSLAQKDIFEALKSGNAIGVKIWRPIGESMKDKIKRTRVLPELLKAKLEGDTFSIVTDSLIKELRFIGQDGRSLKVACNTIHDFYKIKPGDHYVRTEIEFANQVTFYLNPVCKYDGKNPSTIPPPVIDPAKTLMLRIIGFATLISLFTMIYLIRKKRRRRKRASF